MSTEDFALSISNLVIVILALTIGTTSYIFIIVYLWRARRSRGRPFYAFLEYFLQKLQISGEVNQHLMSIVRMSLNVFAFVISCVVMAGFVSIPLVLKQQIDDLNCELLEVL